MAAILAATTCALSGSRLLHARSSGVLRTSRMTMATYATFKTTKGDVRARRRLERACTSHPRLTTRVPRTLTTRVPRPPLDFQFKAELYMDKLPITSSNFADLAKTGFYDGLSFHRVISGFMCQFGCPHSKDPASPRAGTGGPVPGSTYKLPNGDEITRQGGNIPDELIDMTTNDVGTLSMANTGAPNSGGSQFFLNVNDNANLDWFSGGQSKHPVFGKVVDQASFDVAVKISQVPTRNDNPVTPIMMKSVTISGL